MVRDVLNEIDRALFDISCGGHFIGIMIGNWTVWPISWLIEEIKERITL